MKSLGDRMKDYYENRTKQFLIRRMPTIIRLDGKAFHTYTKNLDKPFDEGLIEDMQKTTKFLCENIQGCKLGYTQSDEITLVLTDYDKLSSDAWFNNSVQKITSISASMATAKFNQLRADRAINQWLGDESIEWLEIEKKKFFKVENVIYKDYPNKLAFFDSRVFQIPELQEVVNCLIFRQQDAERNSKQMLAQSLYSHKQLENKNSSMLQEMCFQKGYNWNDLEFYKKRGSLILKKTYVNGVKIESTGDLFDKINGEVETVRHKWEVVETPIFSKNRNIILDLIQYDYDNN